MNNRKRAQLARYTPAFGILDFRSFVPGGVTLSCCDCDVISTFTNAQVRYALATGKPLRCECTPRVTTPDGFTLLEECREYRLLSCDMCRSEFHRELRTTYFTCFCGIKTKCKEHEAYKFIKTLYQRVSREEHYPGSRHKADLKVRVGDYSIYVEIDGSSHNSTAQKDEDLRHEESFLEHRTERDFLLRIREDSMGYKRWTEDVKNYFESISEETAPITEF